MVDMCMDAGETDPDADLLLSAAEAVNARGDMETEVCVITCSASTIIRVNQSINLYHAEMQHKIPNRQ